MRIRKPRDRQNRFLGLSQRRTRLRRVREIEIYTIVINVMTYEATFTKDLDMVYISHLDLMTLFRRAIRRTGLSFELTKGFTPRVKISMPQALKLGKKSLRELMSFSLKKDDISIVDV